MTIKLSTIAVPSKSKVLQALRDAEDAEHSQYTDAPAHSEAMFISNAIDLLDLQYVVSILRLWYDLY